MTKQAPCDLPIILLAAGESRRMRGSDKLLEDVGGMPLLRRQANMACAVTCGPVLVALPPPPHPRYQCLDGLGANRVPVKHASEGINASLRTAFAALPPHTKAAMLFLADLPELTSRDLKIVLDDVDLNSKTLVWRGATENGKPGHPIVFSNALFNEIAMLSGDTGGQSVITAAGDHVELIPLSGDRARFDLDTPEEWAAWRGTTAS